MFTPQQVPRLDKIKCSEHAGTMIEQKTDWWEMLRNFQCQGSELIEHILQR